MKKNDKKRITLYLSGGNTRKFRSLLALKGVSMSAEIDKMIEKAVQEGR